jgi:hypothetical protein
LAKPSFSHFNKGERGESGLRIRFDPSFRNYRYVFTPYREVSANYREDLQIIEKISQIIDKDAFCQHDQLITALCQNSSI